MRRARGRGALVYRRIHRSWWRFMRRRDLRGHQGGVAGSLPVIDATCGSFIARRRASRRQWRRLHSLRDRRAVMRRLAGGRAASWRGRRRLLESMVYPTSLIQCLLTRDGGRDTGSKEKFSMRFAWMRDCCNVEDKLRSSCSACGLNGSFVAVSPAPVRPVTCWRAPSGSISWLTSLKRTDCGGCSEAGDAMMGWSWVVRRYAARAISRYEA